MKVDPEIQVAIDKVATDLTNEIAEMVKEFSLQDALDMIKLTMEIGRLLENNPTVASAVVLTLYAAVRTKQEMERNNA